MNEHAHLLATLLDSYIVGSFWFLLVLIIVFRVVAMIRKEG